MGRGATCTPRFPVSAAPFSRFPRAAVAAVERVDNWVRCAATGYWLPVKMSVSILHFERRDGYSSLSSRQMLI